MTGPNFATVSACATGGHAIGEASEIIRRGDADIMIAGGAEAGDLRGRRRRLRGDARAVDAQRRPGAAPRGRSTRAATGSSSARAPASSILEALEHAEARGATILGRAGRLRRDRRRVAHHAAGAGRDRRGPGGAAGAREGRHRRPTDIDHVNAHATSTPEGDKAELQAIRTIFGDDAERVAITANKSMLGHTLGAAGAIEAIVTILAIREGCVPPTINLDDPDPEAAGPRPDARTSRRAADDPRRAQQLVRVRRPEHGPRSSGGGTR